MLRISALAIVFALGACAGEPEELGEVSSEIVGDNDHCSASSPCPAGEGDCDNDNHCTGAGVVCGINNGERYGYAQSKDFCWPDHCEDGIQNGDEDGGVNCGPSSLCGPCTPPGKTNGDSNYCSRTYPCSSTFGDCDGDLHCTGAGVVCGSNNGSRYGFSNSTDVCWPDHCEDGVQNGDEDGGVNCGPTSDCGPCDNPSSAPYDQDYCSKNFLCPATVGDCDADQDCQAGLYCRHNVGLSYGASRSTDICTDPNAPAVAFFTVNPQRKCGFRVRVDATGSFDPTPGGTIGIYNFSFDDGTGIITGAVQNHYFPTDVATRDYNVQLQIITMGFEFATFNRTLTITCTPPPAP